MKLLHFKGDIIPEKMNFGCGANLLPGYTNVDVHIDQSLLQLAINGVFSKLIAVFEGELLSPSSLPLNYFTSIKAEMVMEHIHVDKLPSVLYSLYCHAAPGGVLHITVPNFDALASLWVLNRNPKVLREITFQLLDPIMGSKYARGHQSLWTEEFAKDLLMSEGWDNIAVTKEGPSEIFLHITANKPTNNTYSVSTTMMQGG